ncbi:MAG: hypothetical protein ACTS2F_27655 [Thainema sp.]
MDAMTVLENLDSHVSSELRREEHKTAQRAVQVITRHLWLSDVICFIRQEAIAGGYHEAIDAIDTAGDTLSRLEEERRDRITPNERTQRIVGELASEVSLAELAEMLAAEAEKQGCPEGARALEIASSNLPC